MDRLEREIAKLNRRAAKIGCPPLEIIRHGVISRVAPGHEDRAEIWGNGEVPHINLIQVEIKGQGPLIAGYKFLGTLDHVTIPGSVIVNTVPGETIPQHFHNSDAVCGHCGYERRRNETFVLQHEDGGYIQVGRQCIKDFLGHNPQGVAAFLSRIQVVLSELGDEDSDYWNMGGGRVEYTFSHNNVLKITAAVIRRNGGVPRSKAGVDDGAATADLVRYYFFPPMVSDGNARRCWEEWRASLEIDRHPEFMEDAEKARLWLKDQPDSNEYMHNLHVLDRADEIPVKMFGYWCSLMAAYQRAMEKLRLAKAEKKVSEHVGEVGKRWDFNVKVVSIKFIDGAYGTTGLVRMLDDSGRTIVWFSSSSYCAGMKADGEYTIVGTIKKHDEFNGWKQTIVTRVKVI